MQVLRGRIALKAGDFNRDALWRPFGDVVLMSDIPITKTLRQMPALVKKIHSHLNPGGRLIIKDRFSMRPAPARPGRLPLPFTFSSIRNRAPVIARLKPCNGCMTEDMFRLRRLKRTAVVQGVNRAGQS